MKKLLSIITFGLLFSCSTKEPLPKYDIVYNDVYEIPIKTQVEQRVIVPADISDEDLTRLLNQLYSEVMNKGGYKYVAKPTHVYIYAHTPNVDYKKEGYNWIGMFSRIDNKVIGVELKDEV